MGGYIGATAVGLVTTAADVQGDITSTDTTPELILKNTSEEDTEGGREGKITFKGEQSGGEESTLAQIQSSHDGTSDDQKGDLIFKTNDGSDGTSPTERLRIDSAGSIIPATLGTDNVHLGEGAGNSIASGGNQNTLIGKDAGTAITTGDFNTAIGANSLDANTTADYNTAVGYNALTANTTGTGNVAAGVALGANTTANDNTAMGNGALGSNTTGASNTAIGRNALVSNTTASENTAIGKDAATANTTGTDVVAVGMAALTANTTGIGNVAVGRYALASNTTANGNVAVGGYDGTLQPALRANTTGDKNVAVGSGALAANTTAASNTAVGYNSGNDNTTGAVNTFIGREAGAANTTSGLLTYVGGYAGANTTGANNTFIGTSAGESITSGSENTVLGRFNGNQNNLDIRTLNNNIILSDGDGLHRLNYYHNGGISAWFASNATAAVHWPTTGSTAGRNAIVLENGNGTLGVTSNASPFYINKNDGDGNLALFYSEGNFEGSISVSGSTVSYNGGHLSRWSQLEDGSKDDTLVKGTVMTNLDKMAVWEHVAVSEGDKIKSASGVESNATAEDVAEAYTEDNEQLNCMAVSSVEGDPNVAGVFVNWDATDDEYNDLNVAMTGDMVIRIAKGTTVARGDLLMSAGDGTAKPQGDDIVRSKTIAKVTSTNVSHTYDDESYLVPCVLMAC